MSKSKDLDSLKNNQAIISDSRFSHVHSDPVSFSYAALSSSSSSSFLFLALSPFFSFGINFLILLPKQRFQILPKKNDKVKVDKRFERMLTDEAFGAGKII